MATPASSWSAQAKLAMWQEAAWHINVQVGMLNIGSFSGNGGEVCEELKKMIDVCCLQEVRWRGYGSMMLWMVGRRYIVVVWISRWSLWCGGYHEGVAV